MDSTQNIVQTCPNANVSGEFLASVTTRPIPMIKNGAADSMSIAAILVYILDISGESTSRTSARARRRRKHIIEVTTTFKPTLSETHGTATLTSLPPSKDSRGKTPSTIVRIAITAPKKARRHNSESFHQMNDMDYIQRTRECQVCQCRKDDDVPLRAPNYETSVHLSIRPFCQSSI